MYVRVIDNRCRSPRLVEYILLGCVPVLVSDDIEPPFHTVFAWDTFSIRVSPSHIGDLHTTLTAANYTTLYRNLMRARPFFIYSLDLGSDGFGWDSALSLIMFEMWRRRDT